MKEREIMENRNRERHKIKKKEETKGIRNENTERK